MEEDLEQAKYLSCSKCNFETLDTFDFNTHFASIHGVELFSYRCNQCKFQTITFAEMEEHVSNHFKGVVRYRCSHCQKFDTDKKEAFERHSLGHRVFDAAAKGSPDFRISGPIVENKKDQSEKEHAEQEAFPKKTPTGRIRQPRTGAPSDSTVSLKKKKRTRAQISPPETPSKTPTLSPVKTPNGYSWYKCDRCDYQSTQKQEVEYHLNTHLGLRPFVCPHNGCDYASSHRSNLGHHVKRIHPEFKKEQA